MDAPQWPDVDRDLEEDKPLLKRLNLDSIFFEKQSLLSIIK